MKKSLLGKLDSLSGYVFGYQNRAAFKKKLESKAKKGILLTKCGFDIPFDSFMTKADSNHQKRYTISVINYLADWSFDPKARSIGRSFKRKYPQYWPEVSK